MIYHCRFWFNSISHIAQDPLHLYRYDDTDVASENKKNTNSTVQSLYSGTGNYIFFSNSNNNTPPPQKTKQKQTNKKQQIKKKN